MGGRGQSSVLCLQRTSTPKEIPTVVLVGDGLAFATMRRRQAPAVISEETVADGGNDDGDEDVARAAVPLALVLLRGRRRMLLHYLRRCRCRRLLVLLGRVLDQHCYWWWDA